MKQTAADERLFSFHPVVKSGRIKLCKGHRSWTEAQGDTCAPKDVSVQKTVIPLQLGLLHTYQEIHTDFYLNNYFSWKASFVRLKNGIIGMSC